MINYKKIIALYGMDTYKKHYQSLPKWIKIKEGSAWPQEIIDKFNLGSDQSPIKLAGYNFYPQGRTYFAKKYNDAAPIQLVPSAGSERYVVKSPDKNYATRHIWFDVRFNEFPPEQKQKFLDLALKYEGPSDVSIEK